MPTNYETEKYEVGDLVIYYGYGGGSKILGVVLNCAEFETSDYYRRQYKNYYGKSTQ